jgi:DNA-binding IclR family transcriptional regulator
MKNSKPAPSSSALRAFAVLETVVRADRPLAMTEIVATHQLPKPTVFRLLATLESAGLVVREPVARAYSMGPRLAELGLAVMTSQSLRSRRRAILRRVAEETGETCNLTTVDGIDVVYLDRIESQWPLRIDLKPGSRVPLHCSASGKLFLSQLPGARRRVLLKSLPLKRHTDNTIIRADLLEAELDRTRKSRVGIDNEEFMAGLICVAVPVVDATERHIASIAVQAPLARLTASRALDYVPVMRRAAAEIAASFTVFTQAAVPAGNKAPQRRRLRSGG